ncbi:hypothetical protein GCM10010909_10770 [Acidocella aquatica]|uniref:Uncharacterized protein n=1 Tax=Acidocella aquatica TaxID=1922313 RepID=A0ABQ6A766_9PROT|nr:hypothetical protein GCM10010909_10770 [Acidocella aquatica]
MTARPTPNRYDNIEPYARAICERELAGLPDMTTAALPALVDRFWPVIAAELIAGLRNDDGERLPHSAARGLEAWEDWLDSQ